MKPLENYNNILIFNPAFLGDTVLTTPLIRLIKKLYPKANIYFCVRPEHASLFEGLNLITKVILFDKRKNVKGIVSTFRFIKYLKTFNFDLVIDLHRSFRSTWVCSSLKPAKIIGFRSAVFSFLFTASVERKQSLHEVERNLQVLSILTENFSLNEAKKLAGNLTCYIDENLKSKIKHYFIEVNGGKKIIGIAPGSVWNTKKYPAEYFAAVAAKLYNNGYAIALFGSLSDIDATETFKKNFNSAYYDFASKTSLKELPAFLSAMDLLLVNDSGSMHIAIAAGVPCIAIFGPTVKELGFFPYDKRSVVLENNNLLCRPCGRHGGKRCPQNHFKCMKDINPEIVAETAVNMLKRKQ